MTHETTFIVTVIETPEFKVRYWIFRQLLRLAVEILGCGIKFVMPDETDAR